MASMQGPRAELPCPTSPVGPSPPCPVPPGQPGRRPGHPLWNPLPPGDRPLTYTIHYRLLGLFPKTETFSYTWDTGGGTVPESGRPLAAPAGPAGLRAAEREVPPSPCPLPLWAGDFS